jgi:hypothetical protein
MIETDFGLFDLLVIWEAKCIGFLCYYGSKDKDY